MRYKNLFLKQPELTKQLQAVAHAEWFQVCLAYVRGELMDTPNISTDNLIGANKFEQILLSLADEDKEPEWQEPPHPLRHDLDINRKANKEEKE